MQGAMRHPNDDAKLIHDLVTDHRFKKYLSDLYWALG